MEKIFYILLFTVMPIFIYCQNQDCEDPDPITITTDCGTTFDLCIDRYIMNGEEGMELKVFTNDMGMFDVCESFICSPCSHGTLTRMENCNFYYVPHQGWEGKDTFYYSMIINDTCTDEEYCEDGDGKIWTIYGRYTGPDNMDLKVYSKNGHDFDFVDEVNNLYWGDYFYIDGSHLPKGQANWEFRFYPNDDGSKMESRSEEIIIDVHTSCSEMIFGKDFGYFRVISGCVATHQERGNCPSDYQQGSLSRAMTTITSQTIDTTMVVITVGNILPIEISDFKVIRQANGNELSWQIENVLNESFMTLESSDDGIEFMEIVRFDNIERKPYTFIDSKKDEKDYSYYRLAIYSFDKSVQFSEIIMIRNEQLSGLSIYPNPTNGTLTLEIKSGEPTIHEYKIYDISGKLLASAESLQVHKLNISMSDIVGDQGYYMIQVRLENGWPINEKILFIKNE